MSPFQRGYEARMNGEPKNPQGDLTISENIAWERGWEAADDDNNAPPLEDTE